MLAAMPKPEPATQEAKPQKETITIPAPMRQICNPFSSRYVLNTIQFRRNSNGCFLAATNGKIAVVVPCAATMVGEALIPRDVLPVTLPKSTKWKDRSYRVERDDKRWFGEVYEGNVGTASGLRVAYPAEGRFPKIADVMGECGEIAVTIDVNELAKIAEALSHDGTVTLFIHADDQREAIKGVNVYGERGIGKLMAKSSDGHEDQRRLYAEKVNDYKG